MSDLARSDRLNKTNIQPHDPQFDHAMQVQVIIPKSIFERQGVEITPKLIWDLNEKVLLKMPRFQGFHLYFNRRNMFMPNGDVRLILERNRSELHQNIVITFVLPENFMLPPELVELPGNQDE